MSRLLSSLDRILLDRILPRCKKDLAAAVPSTRWIFAVSHANYLFTSESVSEGHPDKVCDQISDAVLDAFIENDLKLGIADRFSESP